MTNKFLTINEAAARLGISPKTLRRWEEQGIISPHRTIGNQRRFLVADVEKLERKSLSINEAAARIGISAETLRRWEEKGIIASTRTVGNQRRFALDDIEKLEVQTLSINDAAVKLGISTKTLRRWEEKGIIASTRTVGNQRRYSLADIKLVEKHSLSVNEAAEHIGVSAETLRRWEEKGIIASTRTVGNQRRFNLEDIQKLQIKNYARVKTSKSSSSTIATPLLEKEPEVLTPVNTDTRENKIFSLPKFQTPKIYFPDFSLQIDYRRISKNFALASLCIIGGFFVLGAANWVLTAGNNLDKEKLASLFFRGDSEESTVDEDNHVLAEATKRHDYALKINIPTEFMATASVAGKFTAPNVVYNLIAGENITITGDPQTPVISASVDGLELIEGEGITIDGLTITNDDPGSAQKIFGNIKVGSTTLTASSNTDTVEFSAGSGISLSTDTSSKKVTITNSSSSQDPSGWTDDGTVVRLTTISDTVGIGTTTPSTTLHVVGTGTFSSNLTLGSSLILGGDTLSELEGTDTGIEVVGGGTLSLITTCADNEILKYTAAGGWECSSDAGAGAAVAGTGAQNQIAYWTNATTIAGNNNFYWDSTNERFGIGTSGSPLGKVHVSGFSSGKALVILNETGNQDILTASASGTTVANLSRTGALSIEGALSDLGGTVLEVNDDLKVTGNDIIDSGDTTRITLGATTTLTNTNLTLSGTTTLDATSLTAINGGATAINLSEFDVSAANGGITIDDDGNAGHITIEGTTLDLDSLITGGSNDLTLTAAGGNLFLSSGTALNAGGGAASSYNFFADSVAGADGTILGSDNDLYIEDDLEVDGQIRFGNLTYTWPTSIGANNYVLQTQTDGTLAWADTAGFGTNYWDRANGALYPKIATVHDLLLGSNATSSAKFAFTNVAGGTPTASISAITAGNALSLDAGGNIFTTNKQTLTLGSASTGNIAIGNTGFTTCTSLETIGGVITCGSDDAGTAATNYWQMLSGAISPFSETLDVLIGSTATSSAEFAITGIAGGAPTATLSATTNGNGIALSASDARIQSLNLGTLTIGGNSTGNIILDSGSGLISLSDTLSIGGTATITTAGVGTGFTSLTVDSVIIDGTTIGHTTDTDLLSLANGALTINGTGTFTSTLAVQGTSIGLDNDADADNLIALSAAGSDPSGSLFWGNRTLCDSTGNCVGGPGGSKWVQNNTQGILYPNISTLDVLFGGVSTASAKFAVLNMAGGTPIATLSAGTAGGAYLTAGGNLTTTAYQSLALGGSDTGNITIAPKGGAGTLGISASTLTINGQTGATSAGLTCVSVEDGIVTAAGGCGAGAGGSKWTVADGTGVLYPQNPTVDLLIGGTSTASAKFAIINVAGSLSPIASLSAGTTGGSYLTAAGKLASTAKQTLTLGDTDTGNIALGISGFTTCTALETIGGVITCGTDSDSGSNWDVSTTNGTINPKLASVLDLLLGSTATSSAEFAITGIAGGTPVATLSATTGATNGNGISLTATTATIQSLQNTNLTLGGSTTGNIILSDLTFANAGLTVASGQTTTLASFTNDGGVVYANTSGQLFQTTAGTASQCLIGGSTPTWSSCSGVAGDDWDFASGSLSPKFASVADLLLGSTATSSAEFAVTGIAAGTPTATLAASTNNLGLVLSAADATIQSLQNSSLTLGGLTTGNIILSDLTFANAGLTVASGQSLRLAGLTTDGGLLYTNGSGVVGQTSAGSLGECLISAGGGAPGWGSCVGAGGTNWNVTSGIITPKLSSTLDFLLGGTSTASAKFAVININSGTPTASISAGGAAGGAYLSATGTLATTARQSLTLGDVNTGEIFLGTDATARNITIGNSTSGTALTIDTGTGGINFGDNANMKTIDIGGVTNSGTDTIRIATNNSAADVITIGNNNSATTLALTGGDDWSIDATGLGTFAQVNVDNLTLDGTTLSSTADLIINAAGDDVVSSDRWTLGSQTATTLATLDVRGLVGTLSVATVSGQTSFASLVIDNAGTGDIFTASSSGRSRLSLTNAGELRFYDADTSNYTGFRTPSNITSNAVYTLPTALPGSSNYVLIGQTDGTLSWTDAGSLPSVNYWDQASGALFPKNASTYDLLLGSTATSSAEFAITGIASGAPTATLSATTNGNGLYLNASLATLQSLQNQTLTLGGATTGNLLFNPVNGTGFSTFNGRVGVNTTTTPLSTLDVRGNLGTIPAASISGNTSVAGLVVDNSGSGDLFTASRGGVPIFTIQNNGVLVSSNYKTAGGVFYGTSTGAFALSAGGSNGQVLQLNGSNVPVWVDTGGTLNFWQRNSGAVSPFNITDDFLLGSASTSSAKFAVLNMAGGNPTATLSAGATGGVLFDATGALQTTAFQTLSLGGGNTGNITITPKSGGNLGITTGSLTINGQTGANSASLTCVSVEDGIVTAAGGCGAGAGGSKWTVADGTGVLYPQNPTVDLLIGGTSTASAKFAIINVAGSLSPIASLSAGTTGGSYLTAAGNLATTANQTLSFGGATTGNLVFNPLNGSGFSSFNGKLGINNTDLLGTLDVRPNLTNGGTISIASVSGRTAAVGLLVDNSGSGDLFAASSSGLNRFVINQKGNVGIGRAIPSAMLHIDQISDYESGLRVDSTADGFNSNAFEIRSPENTIDVVYNGENRMMQVMGGSTFWNNPALYVQAKAGSLTSLNIGSLKTDVFKGTASIASIAGQTSFSSLVVDNSGRGDIFTASSSGLQRFTIKQNGDLTIGSLTYTFLSSQGTNYVLQNNGSGSLSWIDPGTLPNSDKWDSTLGAIYPKNASVLDFLIGGTATVSAKFGILNVNGSATPIASLSATTASGGNGNGIVLNADGSIQTLRNNTLTLGGSTTGEISIDGTVITPSGDLIFNPVDELVISDTKNLIIGGHVGNVDYNVISDTANTSQGLNSDDDLFIEGQLEIDGTLFADGSIDTALTLGSVVFATTNGVLSENNSNFFWDNTNTRLGIGTTSPFAALDVRATSNTTPAASASANSTFAAMVVDNRGTGDIFTASRGGKTVFTITNDRIQIGTGSATGAGGAYTPQLLGLDSRSVTGDPDGGRQGDIYYNTADDKFRCYQGTGWKDCIATSQSEYLRAEVLDGQSSNLAQNDHLKFNVATSSGQAISLDTLTAYTTGAGSSIGRFTLTAGRTYMLRSVIPIGNFNTGGTSYADYAWYNVTTSKFIGSSARLAPTSSTDNNANGGYAEALITPTSTTVVEIRFVTIANTLNSVGSSLYNLYPSAYIQVVSGAQEVSASEYMRAEMASTQTTDIAISDHIKFSSVDAFSGSSISLNTGSYPGLGRFTLAAGKTYYMRAQVPYVDYSGTALSRLDFVWYNVTGSTSIGSTGTQGSLTFTGDDQARVGYAEAIITPSVTTTVEVRLTDMANLGGFCAAGLECSAYIEVLSDGTKVAQFTGATSSTDGAIGYVPAPLAGEQGSILIGNGDWTAAGYATIGTNLTMPVASFSARTSFATLIADNSLGDIFAASSSGRNRFVIKQNGNVGIGTNLPTNTLSVLTPGQNAMVNIYGAFSSVLDYGVVQSTSIGGSVTAGLERALILQPNGDPKGTVGIGVTVPLATLDIRGNSASTPIASIGGRTNLAGLIVDNRGNGDLFAASSSGQTRFVINQAGNVGVGAAAPQAKLHVSGAESTLHGKSAAIQLSNTASGGDNWYIRAGATGTDAGAGSFSIGDDLAYRFTIDSDGDIGVNTNSPGVQLQLHLSTGGELLLSRDDGTTATDELLGGIGFDDEDGNVPTNILHAAAGIYGYAAEDHATTDKGGYMTFNTQAIDTDDDTANIERMRLTDAGRLGIATTTPLATLDVRGNITNGGTVPIASVSGRTSFAALSVDNTLGDLFTASSSGQARFVINQAGNVGVGTTTPSEKLYINQGSMTLENTANGIVDGVTSYINFVETGFNDRFGILSSFTGFTDDNKLFITANTTGATPDSSDAKLTLEQGGQFGIGITEPETRLDVDSNSNTEALRLRGAAGTTEIADLFVSSLGNLIISTVNGADTSQYLDLRGEDDEFGVIIRDSTGASSTPYANFYMNDAAIDYLNINVGNNNATTGLVLQQRGSVGVGVGIGVTTPLATLDVRGNSGTTPIASLSARTSFAGLVVDNSLGDLFTASSSGLPRFTVKQNGDILVGSPIGGGGSPDLQLISSLGTSITWSESTAAYVKARYDASNNFLTFEDEGTNILTILRNSNSVSIGDSTSARGTLYVTAASDTLAVASISAKSNSFAAMVVDNTGSGDLFTASASGLTRFRIANNGDVTIKASGSSIFQIQNQQGGQAMNVDSLFNKIDLLASATGLLGASSWSSTSTLITTHDGSTAVAANGFIYNIAGASEGSYANSTDVEYARVNADGSLGSWMTTTSVPDSGRSEHTSVTSNGYVYVLGGINAGGHKTTVYYAKLNPDGTIGSWSLTTSLPDTLIEHSSVVLGDYVYVFGGYSINDTNWQDTVYYARLNPDGTLGAWNTATALPAIRSNMTAVTANGFIYLLGGKDGSALPGGTKSTIYYARPAPNGNITNWQTSVIPLPASRQIGTSVVSNGYVYYIGGKDNTDSDVTNVFYAPLNSDGSTGTWNSTTMLPDESDNHATVIVNGYIYVIGGNDNDGGFSNNTTYYISTARLRIGGNLDLIGLQGQSIASNSGDLSLGTTGGSLTAGNGFFVGGLQVIGQTNLTSTLNVNGNFTAMKGSFFQNSLGTAPVASISANTSYAGLVVDNKVGDIFAASSSGLNRFVIKQSGNVGINTTTPNGPLHVKTLSAVTEDTIARFSAADDRDLVLLQPDNADNADPFTWQTNNAFQFRVDAIDALFIEDTGQVGIANTAPGQALDVTGIINASSDVTVGGVSLCRSNGTNCPSGNTQYWTMINGALSPGGSANPSVDLLVGGVSTASATFHVYGSNRAGTNPVASIAANTSFAGLVADNKGSGDLFTASSSGLSRFVITQSGNVGIGTTLPTSKLHVASSLTGDSLAFFRNNADLADLEILTLSGSRNLIQAGNGDSLNLSSNDSTTPMFTVASNGRIGVNSFTPIGSFDVRPNLTDGGTISVASIAGKTSFAALIVDASGSGDLIAASSSGLSRFVIKQNGNVGINTTNPTSNLYVAQTHATTQGLKVKAAGCSSILTDPSVFSVESSDSSIYMDYNDCTRGFNIVGGSFFFGTGAFSVRSVADNATTASFFGSGMGMTSDILNIYTGYDTFNAYAYGKLFAINPNGTTPTASISGTTAKATLTVDNLGVGDLFTASSSGLNRFVIKNNGNVGIGTNVPAGIFEVINSSVGSTDHIGLLTSNASTADSFSLGMTTGNGRKLTLSAQGGALRQAMVFGDATTTTDTIFGIGTSSDSGGTWDPRFVIRQNGTIAMGTATPLATLDIRGASDTLAVASVSGKSNSFAAMVVDNRGSGDIFTASYSGATRFVIKNNGQVGIGTATTSGNLTIRGDTNDGSSGIDAFNITDRTMSGYFFANYYSTQGGNPPYASIGSYSPTMGDYQNIIFNDGNGGSVGIGTANPGGRLDVISEDNNQTALVLDNLGSSSNNWLSIETNGSQVGYWDIDELNIGGRLVLDIDTNSGTEAMCHTGDDTETDSTLQSCSGAPTFDYAEMYATAPDVTYGDIVTIGNKDVYIKAIDGSGTILEDGSMVQDKELVKSTKSYDRQVIGIISNNHGDFSSTGHGRIDPADHPMPVALNGRVPVKIALTSDPIEAGDYITTSDIPGRGMKATQAGQVIGKALEAWTPESGKDQILVFVTDFWRDPDIYLTSTGNLDLFEKPGAPVIEGATLFGVRDAGGNETNRVAVFSEAVVGNLRTGSLEVQDLTLGGQNLTNKLIGLENFASSSALLSGPVNGIQSSLQSLSDRVASIEARLNASGSAFFNNNSGLDLFTASSSAELNLDTLFVNGAIVTDRLSVIGTATLNELGVTGNITAGLLTIKGYDGGGASISTLNGDLKLQEEGFGGVDILNGKVTVDIDGNLETVGEITTAKLNIDTTNTLSASAGNGTVLAGTKTVVINTSAVTADSLIQITFTSDYSPAARYWIKSKTAGSSFTLELNQPVAANSKFSWMIVN